MAQNYISIRQIADDIYDNPLLNDLPFERIVNLTVRFTRRMGLPQMFDEDVAKVEIHQHRGLLPCNLYNIIQVKDSCTNITFTVSSDSFFYTSTGRGPLTYKVQDRFIYTSMPEGVIEISYTGFKVDNDGYPMLPDDSNYINALELYIKKETFTNLFEQNKISQAVLINTQKDCAAAMMTLRSDMSTPSVDEMEVIARMWNRLLPEDRMHQSGFITGNYEQHHRF